MEALRIRTAELTEQIRHAGETNAALTVELRRLQAVNEEYKKRATALQEQLLKEGGTCEAAVRHVAQVHTAHRHQVVCRLLDEWQAVRKKYADDVAALRAENAVLRDENVALHERLRTVYRTEYRTEHGDARAFDMSAIDEAFRAINLLPFSDDIADIKKALCDASDVIHIL